jgi:hypothetical protein
MLNTGFAVERSEYSVSTSFPQLDIRYLHKLFGLYTQTAASWLTDVTFRSTRGMLFQK